MGALRMLSGRALRGTRNGVFVRIDTFDSSGSGVAMPTGNVVSNGRTWAPETSIDFTTNATFGAARAAYPKIVFYPEGSGNGKYLADQTVTVANSMMDVYVRHIGTVDAGAAMLFKRADGTEPWTGGRFTFRFRADPSAAGYGGVFQLWPATQLWAEGEMDFPEGDFGGQMNLYHHEVGANPANNYLVASNLGTWDQWHTGTIEWVPGTSARYYLDGVKVGEVTNAAQVATTPHNFVLQMASHTTETSASDTAAGHFQLDWVVIQQEVASGTPGLITPTINATI